jgi:6 kDa early secretory antigenic target
MSGSSGITVSFGTVSQAQGDVANTVARIDQQLADLRNFIAPLVATWEGGASTDYQTLQKRWDNAANDMNVVLRQISQHLGQAHEGYQMTESANAGCWG